jgi:multiple sugar transport system permease protein
MGARRILPVFFVFPLIVTLFPFVWMVSTSFKGPGEIFTRTPTFLPAEPTLENYRNLFSQANLGRSFFNSLVFALGMMTLSVLCNAMAAYAFAKLSFPGREKLFSLLLLTMMVPGQVTMMPVFLILKTLGLAQHLYRPDHTGNRQRFRHFHASTVHARDSRRDP